MHSPIRIAQIGLGPLGQMLTPYLVKRSNIEIVSAVDIDPSKTGRDLGEVSQCDQPLGIAITDDLDRGLADADLAVVTTVSELQRIAPTLKAIIDRGVNIVSTCEELSLSLDNTPRIIRNHRHLGKRTRRLSPRNRHQPRLSHGLLAHSGHGRVSHRAIHSHRTHPGRLCTPSPLSAKNRGGTHR